MVLLHQDLVNLASQQSNVRQRRRAGAVGRNVVSSQSSVPRGGRSLGWWLAVDQEALAPRARYPSRRRLARIHRPAL
jgi:hypothetical protein